MKSSRKSILNPSELSAAKKSGRILAEVRDLVAQAVVPGVRFDELEKLAQQEIAAHGATPSFTTVEDYHWAICVNTNEGCCHGIPVGGVVKHGDIVTIDIGAVWEGIHTDSAVTVCAGKCSDAVMRFLDAGRRSLDAAIAQVQAGNTVYDISKAMEDSVRKDGFYPIYQLTGHGVGKELHMPPNIPCFADPRSKRDILEENQMIAVEVMYSWGNPTLVLAKDGWTYETQDGSLTGMFEHSVVVGKDGCEVVTSSRA